MDLETISQVVRAIFFSFILISVFLLVGTFLRAKIKLFQNLFLPASVIGGFIGLLLGPIVLNKYAVFPIPADWITIASLLPGLLIVPVVASVPLGIKFKNAKNENPSNADGGTKTVFIMFFILAIVGGIQNLVSIMTAGTFKHFLNYESIYPTFGTEVSAGFAGGHGTAGVVGSLLQSLNQPYWNIAQGVATTTATVGIICGILIGIILINIAARKGYTQFIKTGADLPEDMKTGIQKNIDSQESTGKETTNSSSIDSLSFHLALILMVSGLAFVATYTFKKFNIPVLNLIPEWAYAILLMYAVWGLMQKLKLDWIVDVNTKTKIASTLTEYAVVAAIISLPIQAVFTFILPLSIMIVCALIVTVASAYYLSKKFFTDFWFERSMVVLGTNTGVFLTGLLLLKMVDPDMKSPLLRDYSLSYSINSIVGFVLFPLSFGLLVNYGFLSGIGLYVFLLILFSSLLLIVSRKRPKKGEI